MRFVTYLFKNHVLRIRFQLSRLDGFIQTVQIVFNIKRSLMSFNLLSLASHANAFSSSVFPKKELCYQLASIWNLPRFRELAIPLWQPMTHFTVVFTLMTPIFLSSILYVLVIPMQNGQSPIPKSSHHIFILFSSGVHDLKPYVDDAQYKRLLNFVYLESEDQINDLSDWIKSLNIKKVTSKYSYFDRNAVLTVNYRLVET